MNALSALTQNKSCVAILRYFDRGRPLSPRPYLYAKVFSLNSIEVDYYNIFEQYLYVTETILVLSAASKMAIFNLFLDHPFKKAYSTQALITITTSTLF